MDFYMDFSKAAQGQEASYFTGNKYFPIFSKTDKYNHHTRNQETSEIAF